MLSGHVLGLKGRLAMHPVWVELERYRAERRVYLLERCDRRLLRAAEGLAVLMVGLLLIEGLLEVW
jgi:hypothetical protein